MIQPEKDKCDFCGTCVSVCPHDAIDLGESTITILNDRCTECMFCVKVCPLRVLKMEAVHAR